MGPRCFLPGPTKIFSPQNKEKTKWGWIFSRLTKMPMCMCTWLFQVAYIFFSSSLGNIIAFIFLSSPLGNIIALFCGHTSLFCFNWVSFFNKRIWVNLFKLIFSIIPLFDPQPNKNDEKTRSFLSSHHFLPFYFSTLSTKRTLRQRVECLLCFGFALWLWKFSGVDLWFVLV